MEKTHDSIHILSSPPRFSLALETSSLNFTNETITPTKSTEADPNQKKTINILNKAPKTSQTIVHPPKKIKIPLFISNTSFHIREPLLPEPQHHLPHLYRQLYQLLIVT
jgi:hypothetical protein